MGGRTGHMDHLYDNPNLTFAQMKDIFIKASAGELEEVTEKTDGQNNVISFDVENQKALAIRTVKHEKKGGITKEELEAYFTTERMEQGKEPAPTSVVEAFVQSLLSFENVVRSFPVNIQKELFLTDQGERIFYNSEVMATENPNVIQYDFDILLVHRAGIKKIDRDTGRLEPLEKPISKEFFDLMEKALDDFQGRVQKEKFKIQGNAIRQLDSLDNDHVLNKALTELEDTLNKVGISDNQTVAEYLISRIDQLLTKKYKLSNRAKRKAIEVLFDFKENNRVLKKDFNELHDILDDENSGSGGIAQEIVGEAKNILSEAIWPLEKVVHAFTVGMLVGFKSFAIIDNSKESERIEAEIQSALSVLQNKKLGAKYPEIFKVTNKQLKKLQSLEDKYVSTPAEGIVFSYDGHDYKFTGNFAPVNQLLGIFKFGRGKIPKLSDINIDLLEEFTLPMYNREDGVDGAKVDLMGYSTVALVPGGFKPPHVGHFQMIKSFAAKSDIVYIIIGASTGKKAKRMLGQRALDYKTSKKIWTMYLKDAGIKNCRFVPVKENELSRTTNKKASPMSIAYDIMQLDTLKGQTVIMGTSTKDARRFSIAASKYIPKDEKENDKINLDLEPFRSISIEGIGEVSASKMRTTVENKEFDTFKKFIPATSQHRAMEIWKLLTTESPEQPEEEDEKLTEKKISSSFLFSLVENLLKEKRSVSKAGQKRVSQKISYLIDKEGKKPDQAAAIAYSMEKRGELKEGGFGYGDKLGDDDLTDILSVRIPKDLYNLVNSRVTKIFPKNKNWYSMELLEKLVEDISLSPMGHDFSEKKIIRLVRASVELEDKEHENYIKQTIMLLYPDYFSEEDELEEVSAAGGAGAAVQGGPGIKKYKRDGENLIREEEESFYKKFYDVLGVN
jgi:hypothetical protein